MKQKFLIIGVVAGIIITSGNLMVCHAEIQFPEKYEVSGEKVIFNCELEIPDDFNEEELYATAVKSRIYSDGKKAIEIYSKGKEVQDTGSIPPASETEPEGTYYTFTDGSSLSYTGGFHFGTDTVRYYNYVGIQDPAYLERFEQSEVSFMQPEECIEKVEALLNEIGIPTDEVELKAYALNHDVIKQIENEEIESGLNTEANRKEEWTEEDDAYFVYGVQKHAGLPVFHEFMNVSRQLAYDTPDSSAIQVIYSTRGVESILYQDVMYDFLDNDEEKLQFRQFEDIAEVVENKYGNLLNESMYEVTRAKLYERVFLNQNQQLEAAPMWYFEILEDNSTVSVTLVDAVLGEEIYLE